MWPASTARGLRLTDRPHALQQWFGVDAFITLVPQSYSGRILATAVSADARHWVGWAAYKWPGECPLVTCLSE